MRIFMPPEIVEGSDRGTGVDAFRFGGEGADHHEILVSPQRPGRHQRGDGHGRLTQSPEQAGHFHHRIIGEPVRGPGDHKRDIGNAIQHQLRLLSRRLAEHAAAVDLDLELIRRLIVDGVDERPDHIDVEADAIGG